MKSQDVAQNVAPGRHDRNKARRRTAILESTLELLRTTDIEKVSIEAIATTAGVAPATVYNLMGSRESLLLSCIDRVLNALVDDLIRVPVNEDPLGSAVRIIERSCDAFIVDGDAFRQIVGAVNKIIRGGGAVLMDAGQLQILAMHAVRDAGILSDDADPVAIGRQIFLSYNGALFAWAARQLTDDGFRAAALHGLWTVLLAWSAEAYREEFRDCATESAHRLVTSGYGSPVAQNMPISVRF